VISASQLERILRCPPSAHLPAISSTSEAAERGTAIHEYLRRRQEVGREKAIEETSEEWRETCEEIGAPLEELGGEWSLEVPMVWNTSKRFGRIISEQGARCYPDLPWGDIPGTADVVGIDASRVHVIDYKTGRAGIKAQDNAQLMFYALVACNVFQRQAARISIVWPGLEGEHSRRDTADVDIFDLDLFADQLVEMIKSVEESRDWVARGNAPQVRAGSWCRYCHSAIYCPARVGLIRALGAGEHDEILRQPIAELTKERAQQAYLAFKQLRSFTDEIGEALRSYAYSHPIELENGVVYGVGPGRRAIDGEKAYAVLEELHGEGFARACCEHSTSISAIRTSLRSITGPRGITKALDAILDAVAKRGGVTLKSNVCEWRPKKKIEGGRVSDDEGI